MITNRIGIIMASTSGTLYFLKKRKVGYKSRLKKKAVRTGMIIPAPSTNIVPANAKPSNSMDLLTVSGNSCIVFINIYTTNTGR